MPLRVLNNKVLVKRDEVKKYEGSIVLPDIVVGAYEKVSPKGTVLSIGDKVRQVNVGDRIYFEQFGGAYLNKEENLLVLTEDEIIGFVDDRP